MNTEQTINHIYTCYTDQALFLCGFVATMVFGYFFQERVQERIFKNLVVEDPLGREEEFFKHGGRIIGFFELILFYTAIASGHPLFIGGLLAFKVAAKWEVWKDIVQMPDSIPGGADLNKLPDEVSYFNFRRKEGSRLLTRFVGGTFSNIFYAIVIYGVFYKGLQVL